jgi:Electron transfer DM13
MTKRRLIIGGVIIGVPVLALGWWLGSPLFLDTEVSEEFPLSAGAVVPDDMTQEDVEAAIVAAAEEPDAAIEENMPTSTPLALASGQFEDFDKSHRGSGTATIYELEDGSSVLRLEDFEVTNGPDLRVYLVPDVDPQGRDDITGYVELGPLKGNIGDQNYEIPAGTDVSKYGSVVIYCSPFQVIFSVAGLG